MPVEQSPQELEAAAAAKAAEDQKAQGAKVEEGKKVDVESEEVKTLKAALVASKEESERAKRYVVNLVGRLKEAAATQPSATEDKEAELEKFKERFEKDPEAALDEHFQKRVAPLQRGTLERQAALFKERAQEKFGEKWQKYEAEIEDFMEPMSIETRSQPGAWEEAFRYVRMLHFDDELKEAVEAKTSREKETQLEGASRTLSDRKTVKPLSSLENKVREEFGMSEEEWRKFGGGNFQERE